MGVEFNDIISFKNKFMQFKQEINSVHLRAAKRIGQLAVRKVKQKTPVGETGQLELNWDYEVYVIDNIYHVVIFNKVEYASYVEKGHRIVVRVKSGSGYARKTVGWVEGKFMMKLTEDELDSLIPIMWDEDVTREVRRIFGD